VHIADASEKMLDEIADDVRSTAVRLAAVDTGRMKGSADVESEKGVRRIGYRTDYSEYVEGGTSRQAAQPSLEPALYRHR
jgi:HK97 gp10 family phage protein